MTMLMVMDPAWPPTVSMPAEMYNEGVVLSRYTSIVQQAIYLTNTSMSHLTHSTAACMLYLMAETHWAARSLIVRRLQVLSS